MLVPGQWVANFFNLDRYSVVFGQPKASCMNISISSTCRHLVWPLAKWSSKWKTFNCSCLISLFQNGLMKSKMMIYLNRFNEFMSNSYGVPFEDRWLFYIIKLTASFFFQKEENDAEHNIIKSLVNCFILLFRYNYV